jgi:hypothetical protein
MERRQDRKTRGTIQEVQYPITGLLKEKNVR